LEVFSVHSGSSKSSMRRSGNQTDRPQCLNGEWCRLLTLLKQISLGQPESAAGSGCCAA
jgi:hypothetical protein